MSATSGRMSGRQFAIYDHNSHSWKTWPDIGLWGLIEYSQTWPKMGYMHDGAAYELAMWGGHTTANEYSFLLPTPTASDWKRADSPGDHRRSTPALTSVSVYFAHAETKYSPAIRHWEMATRPAPSPTVLNKNGKPQLNTMFTEWLMGLPAGWVVSSKIGLTRAQQLKALGNGVVPQQAAHALKLLLGQENNETEKPNESTTPIPRTTPIALDVTAL